MDTNWTPATPARARADARIASDKVLSTKAFEDARVKDHRDVERERGVYLPPSAEEAATHADSAQPRLLSEDGKLEKFKYFDSEVDLGLEFGAGVSGYFFVLRAFACLFFAAFALNLPVMFINYTSTYYASHYEAEPETATAPTADALSGRPTTSFHSWFVDWHWANPMSASLGTVAPDDVPQRAWVLAGTTSGVLRWSSSKIDFIRFSVVMDVVVSLIIILSVPVIMFVLMRTERRVERGTATLKDYTVLVTGLPSDATDEEVRCFFALRFGTVADVVLVKTECMQINAQRRRRRLLEDYDEAEAALIAAGNRGGDGTKTAIEKQILAVDRKLKRRRARTRAKQCSAFITFETEGSKIDCILRNTRSIMSYIFAFPRKERFRGKRKYRVRDAPEPEDVRFENLNLSNRSWRRLVVLFSCSAVVLLCYGFLKMLVDDKEKLWENADMMVTTLADDVGIVVAHGNPVEQFETHKNQFRTACRARLDQCGVAFSKDKTYVGMPWGAPIYAFYDYPNATLLDRRYAQQDAVRDLTNCAQDTNRCPGGPTMQNCHACYCASLKYGLTSEVVRAYNKAIRHSCAKYVNLGPGEYYNWLWVSFCITLMNVLLEWIVPLLVAAERLRTRSATKVLKTKIIFWVRYLNVAVIYVLLNANFYHIGRYFPLIKQMFGLKGEYADFTSEWFNDVGLVLFFAIMMSVTIRILARVLVDIITHVGRKFSVAYCHTQAKLNKAFEGPSFDTGAKCGDVCFTIMAAMTFSSGMPLIYLVLSMYFVLVYLYDYRLLLKVCKLPERSKSTLPMTAAKVLFISVSIHALIGLWMFSYHWTPDLAKPTKDFEHSSKNNAPPLAYEIGGEILNPPHDNGALTAIVQSTGVATTYFHQYRDATVGALSAGDFVAPPPRVQLRFAERPFSEAGMPFMGMFFALLGVMGLWQIAVAWHNWGKSRRDIARSWKNLPQYHEAIMTGLIVGSETYRPEYQPDYAFLFDKSTVAAAKMKLGSYAGGPVRGDSVNSRDAWSLGQGDDDDIAELIHHRYDNEREYDGGAPWVRKTGSKIYGGDAATAKRGSRGTRQRDGGHYGVPVVDVRALGVGSDYNHVENNAFGHPDAFVADDHEWDSASDADTLDDDASTQRSQSFSDYENDDQRFDGARRPAWLD